MKKVLLLSGIVALFAACSSPSASTEVGDAQEVADATAESESFNVNVEESKVNWKGSKITGDSHTGTINITSGSFSTAEGAITAANFELDMTSIASTDGMDEETTGKLLGHLASPDFFDAATHPTANFAVSTASADSLTGNLTIKGISKSITVPYGVEMTETGATATSSFSIDRAQWDVQYGSSSFFDDLKDKAINDAVEFTVSLMATK
ncbi:YceI family protein [Bacteroidia bacterium]|nr:YceI family protein [Bacteroidia bacterium]MDC1395769.1 YceI family protein [Bacteroidia bacterium]